MPFEILQPTKNILQSESKRKKRRKSWVVNSLALAGALVLFTLLGFVHKKQKHNTCWKLEVQIDAPEGKKYLDEKLVTKLAIEAADSIIGQPLDAIDIKAIREKVAANSSVKEAHVFTTVDGRCVVQVKQRTPVARIFNRDGQSFYLDKEGFTMALSTYYTAKVPVFVGNIPDALQEGSFMDRTADEAFIKQTLLDDIYAFTEYVTCNEFWNAQVEHVYVNDMHDFEIIPRVGNHRINMGKAENLEEKFKKLMAFYAHAVHTKDLNDYSSIHVEYDGQVVCVKK